jgi:MFS family permease
MERTIEQSAMRKVYWRLLPLCMLVYFFCYLDRINVSFAALTMNKDLGLDAWVYGLSSTAFYIGYCVFEVPSNIVMEKVGARLWIARIMITWGLISGATAFAVGPNSFLSIRLLLGAAEAGLFPGIILLFTYWFPDHHRARIVSGFTLALPVSVALGAPISTAILGMDGVLGIAGWKWIYLLEAVPTVLIGVVVLAWLTDKPAKAAWLTPAERDWLVGRLAAERRAVEAGGKFSIWQGMVNPRILLLSANYLGIVTPSLGLLLFAPQIIKSLGATNMLTGYATMLAYVCGALSMMFFGWISDRSVHGGSGHGGDDNGDVVVAGRDVPVHRRVLRHQGAILVDAGYAADRHGGGGGAGVDQLDRQCRRCARPGAGRLAEADHGQLFRRAVWAGGVHRDRRADRAVFAKHPQREAARGGGRRRGVISGLWPRSPRLHLGCAIAQDGCVVGAFR